MRCLKALGGPKASSIGAVSKSASVAETLASSSYQRLGVAECAATQNGHSLTLETNAAIRR